MSCPPSCLFQPFPWRSDMEGKERREDGWHLSTQWAPLLPLSLLPQLLVLSISPLMMKIKIDGEAWELSTYSTPSTHLLNPDTNCQIPPYSPQLPPLLHSAPSFTFLTSHLQHFYNNLVTSPSFSSPIHFPHLLWVHLTIALSR